jgi:RNA polymerase-binding protein DksA
MTKKKFSKTDLKNFKKLILKRKEEIQEELRHIKEDALNQSQRDAAGDISAYTLHMADIATDSYDREFSLGIASSDQKVLFEIEDSLKRIDDGTFGACESCSKSIAKTRLKALPYTRLCKKCQEKLERK